MTALSPITPPRSGSRICWVKLTVIVWTIAFLALCGRTLLLKVDRHSVYPVFVSAAENWMHGESLYVRGGKEEFRYSPLVAAFFVPFDWLPPRLGQFLWRALNFGVYVAGLWQCCKVGLPTRLTANQKSAVFLLVLPLSIGSLNNAQSNPLVIGLLLLAAAWALKQKWTFTALAVTAATLFKVYPIAVGLLLLLLYPRRFGWRLFVCLAAGALAPFILQHASYVMDQYATWARYLISEDRQHGPVSDWYRDFRAVWTLYIHPMSAMQYLLVQLFVAAAIAAICLAGRWRSWPRTILLTFLLSLACCWMTAFGPATESSTYILVAPALAWMLVLSQGDSVSRRFRFGYDVVFGLFIVSQVALWFGDKGRHFRDQLQPLPIAGTLLLCILLLDVTVRLFRPPLVTSENL